MNFLIKIARFLKKASKMLGEFCLSFYAWIVSYVIYLPFSFTFYVIDYGFDHKRFLTLKGFRQTFKRVAKSVIFPTEESIRKIGFIILLPLMKGEKEENNPTTSMFSKYFTALQTAKHEDTKLNIAYENVDAVHRKNNMFNIMTFGGFGLLYLFTGAEIAEAGDMILKAGGVGFLGGLTGMGYLGSSSLGGAGAPLLMIIGFLFMVASLILLFAVFAVGYIFLGVSLLCFIWLYKELKTQENLSSFIDANLDLVISSLKRNYAENNKALANIEVARIATLETVIPEKVDFAKIEDKFLLKNYIESKEVKSND